MKRHLILVACAIMMTAFFSACKKENNNNNNDNTPCYARIEFGGSAGEGLAGKYIASVTYELKYAGHNYSTTNSSIAGSEVMDEIPCPCTMTLRLQFRQCSQIIDTNTYDMELSTYLHVTTDKDQYQNTTPTCKHDGVSGTELKALIKEENEKLPTYNISVDEEGKITVSCQ